MLIWLLHKQTKGEYKMKNDYVTMTVHKETNRYSKHLVNDIDYCEIDNSLDFISLHMKNRETFGTRISNFNKQDFAKLQKLERIID